MGHVLLYHNKVSIYVGSQSDKYIQKYVNLVDFTEIILKSGENKLGHEGELGR